MFMICYRVKMCTLNCKLRLFLCLLSKGDSLSYSLGMKFSTKDQDNDEWLRSCATYRKGGWWYRGCTYSNLNGHYYTGGSTSSYNGLYWYLWRGHYSMKFSEMKIRPFYV